MNRWPARHGLPSRKRGLSRCSCATFRGYLFFAVLALFLVPVVGCSNRGSGNPSSAADGGTGACHSTLEPGDHPETLTSGGQVRSYIIHVPPGYDGKQAVPLLFDFHGLGGSGLVQRQGTGFAEKADQTGFIAVFPDGSGVIPSWNGGDCCPPATVNGVDDVAFTRAMIDRVSAEACIDRHRVYATGGSNGAVMSYFLACRAADVIAAVAPIDADALTPNCRPARPISALQFRGTADSIVPYDGGAITVVQPNIATPGAQQNLADWRDLDGCTGSPTPLANHSQCQIYETCSAGAAVGLCTVPNGTHYGYYRTFAVADIAWEFLRRYTLP